MVWSILLYVVMLVACVLLAICAEDTKKTMYVWFIVISLTLIAGLRSINVGIDTVNYTRIFAHVAAGEYDAIGGTERTFLYLVKALQIFTDAPTFLFLLFSFATNALIIFRIWEFKRIISFPWAICYFYTCFYFFTFNIMRQMVAVAIIFWGTRFVQKEKYIHFLAVVAAAFLFHQSALLGILYLVADFLIWKEKRQRHKKLFLAFLGVGALGSVFVLIKAAKYIHYFTDITLNIGFLVPMKLAFVAAVVFLTMYKTGKLGGTSTKRIVRYMDQNIMIYYAFGLFLSMLGYLFTFMDRIGLYFTVFGCLFVGYVRRRTRHPLIALAIFGVVILLPFAMDVVSGGQGQLPYEFFWKTLTTK